MEKMGSKIYKDHSEPSIFSLKANKIRNNYCLYVRTFSKNNDNVLHINNNYKLHLLFKIYKINHLLCNHLMILKNLMQIYVHHPQNILQSDPHL